MCYKYFPSNEFASYEEYIEYLKMKGFAVDINNQNYNTMKLTNKDKNYLLSIGYENDDFTAIEDVTKNIKYELFFITGSKRPKIKLNQKQVIGTLGRETFLSGIARATFHNSAVRTSESLPNVSIYFERKKF